MTAAATAPAQAARWQPTLGDVQETLLIPLHFRAREAARPDAIVRDPEAVRIVNEIDYDFARFDEAWIVGLDCIIRSEIFDERVRAFIERHPDAVIVNLGAGLDARFRRVDNGRIRWFDLDLPDAIELRDRFLPAGGRVRHLALSMFDAAWLEQVAAPPGTPVLVIAEGLFCYCDEADIRRLFAAVAARWPGAHVLFQSISPRYVGREADVGAVNLTRAKLRWGVWSGREVAAWQPGWRLVGEWAFIDRHRQRWGRLRWLSLLPWVRHDLRTVMKVSEVALGDLGTPLPPTPLAPFEQLMLADTRPGYPLGFFLECEVEGPLCRDRLADAVARAAARHPLARSRVAVRGGQPCWLSPDVMPVIEDASPAAWRPHDLARESGLRLVVLPTVAPAAEPDSPAPSPRHRLVLFVHHAVCDGIAAAEFLGDVWALYDGREPPRFSPGRRSRETPPAPGPAFGRSGGSTGFAAFATFRPRPLRQRRDCGRAARPAGQAARPAAELLPPYEWFDLDPAETARLRQAVAAAGWSLNDAVVAAVIRAANRWNEAAGGRAGNVRITLPVSLRPPGFRGPLANGISYAFLDRRPADCRDLRFLAASVAEASRWIVETGAAGEFLAVLGMLARRHWLLKFLTRLPVCFSTAVVSTIGDPARRMKSGVPKQDGLDAPGGLVIRGMRGVPPLRPGTRAALAALTYGGQLSLTCLCSAGSDPRAAAREFLRLVADELAALS
jgi:O-methyltransferase involved in polyketide biosynthesis